MVWVLGEKAKGSYYYCIILVCAVAPKQVDYMNEVKEFEAEMRKHSHKFPHDILTYYIYD